MEVLILLIPAAIGLSAVGLSLFIWAVRHRQFEDLDGPQWRILFEQDGGLREND